jgi:hypothetical protein
VPAVGERHRRERKLSLTWAFGPVGRRLADLSRDVPSRHAQRTGGDVWRTPARRIAFGWDRTTGMDSIREVIAFPKTGGRVDPLTDAPAPISARQRKESGIDAKPEQVDQA